MVAPVLDEFGLVVERIRQAPVREQQTAWQPTISNLSHRDASDRASLPFPVSEVMVKIAQFRTFNADARVERVAVCLLVFFLICGFVRASKDAATITTSRAPALASAPRA